MFNDKEKEKNIRRNYINRKEENLKKYIWILWIIPMMEH